MNEATLPAATRWRKQSAQTIAARTIVPVSIPVGEELPTGPEPCTRAGACHRVGGDSAQQLPYPHAMDAMDMLTTFKIVFLSVVWG